MHKLILNTYGQYLYGVRLIFAESEIFIAIFGKRKRVFLMMVFLTVDSLKHKYFCFSHESSLTLGNMPLM